MQITVGSLLRGAQEAEGTAIIIDVFRAFTTAAVAFSRGAERIVLVAEVADALRLRDQGHGDLCMGEVSGMRPEGFDFGNSPYEISQANVAGKTIVQSTRAGTVGVAAATVDATDFRDVPRVGRIHDPDVAGVSASEVGPTAPRTDASGR